MTTQSNSLRTPVLLVNILLNWIGWKEDKCYKSYLVHQTQIHTNITQINAAFVIVHKCNKNVSSSDTVSQFLWKITEAYNIQKTREKNAHLKSPNKPTHNMSYTHLHTHNSVNATVLRNMGILYY